MYNKRPTNLEGTDAQQHEQHTMAGFSVDGRCGICYHRFDMETMTYPETSEAGGQVRITRQDDTFSPKDPSSNRPWWRHWHVYGHDMGYTLKEARKVLEVDNQHYQQPIHPEEGITRCDEDHSLHNPIIIHVGR